MAPSSSARRRWPHAAHRQPCSSPCCCLIMHAPSSSTAPVVGRESPRPVPRHPPAAATRASATCAVRGDGPLVVRGRDAVVGRKTRPWVPTMRHALARGQSTARSAPVWGAARRTQCTPPSRVERMRAFAPTATQRARSAQAMLLRSGMPMWPAAQVVPLTVRTEMPPDPTAIVRRQS